MSRITNKAVIVTNKSITASLDKTSGSRELLVISNGSFESKFSASGVYFELGKSEAGDLAITVKSRGKSTKLSGTIHRKIQAAIHGMLNGHSVEINLSGVGFKASVANSKSGVYLILNLGYSHPIAVCVPKLVNCSVPEQTKIILTSFDLEVVTAFAAVLRLIKPREPYKGKGVIIVGRIERPKKEIKVGKK